jgi:hypothetical protein
LEYQEKKNEMIIEMHIGYWWESQKFRDHGENQNVVKWTIIKWILER